MRNSIVTLFVAAIFAIATFFNPAATTAMTLEEFEKLDTSTKVKVGGEFCGSDRKCTAEELAPVKLSYGMGAQVNVDFNDPAPASAPATTPPTAPASLMDHGASDQDGDSVLDEADNCLVVKNFGQLDRDHDGSGDLCDNCPDTSNVDQLDRDRDGWGDRCDNCPDLNTSENGLDCNAKHVAKLPKALPGSDPDGDGISEGDECSQAAEDEDGFQDDDGCPDPDNDGDGVLDVSDRCPMKIGDVPNNGCPPASQQLLAAAPPPPEDVPPAVVQASPLPPAPPTDTARSTDKNRDGRAHWFVSAKVEEVPEMERLRERATNAAHVCRDGDVGIIGYASGDKESHPKNPKFAKNREDVGCEAVKAAGGNCYRGGVAPLGVASPAGRGTFVYCEHGLAKDAIADGRFNAGSGRPGDGGNTSPVVTDDHIREIAKAEIPNCWDLNRNKINDPDEDTNKDGKFDELDCRPKQQDTSSAPSGFHFGVGAFGIPSFYDGESAIGGLYLSLGWRIAALNGPMARLYGGVGGSDYSYGGMAGLTVAWDVTDWLDIGPGLGANASWLNDLSLTPEYHFGLIGQVAVHYGRARLAFEPGFGIEVEKYEGDSYRRFRGAVLGGVEF